MHVSLSPNNLPIIIESLDSIWKAVGKGTKRLKVSVQKYILEKYCAGITYNGYIYSRNILALTLFQPLYQEVNNGHI